MTTTGAERALADLMERVTDAYTGFRAPSGLAPTHILLPLEMREELLALGDMTRGGQLAHCAAAFWLDARTKRLRLLGMDLIFADVDNPLCGIS